MFKRRFNELRLTLQLAPAAPLLIKEGRHIEGGDKERRYFHRGPVARTPDRPRRREGKGFADYDDAEHCFDMACVYTTTAQGEDRFYLPGSSLRGVLRSSAERLIGRWQPGWVHQSDPFRPNAQEIDRGRSGAVLYSAAGPIERCFGHTALRGRWVVADAWLCNERDARVVVRDGVGINRATGAAQQNVKFQFETITAGIFETTIMLTNFELWQPGLLAYLLAGLDAGDAQVGYGTRRGLGRVRVAVTEMRWRWYGRIPEQQDGLTVVPPLAALASRAGLEGYDWRDADLTLHLPLQATRTPLASEARMIPARVTSSDPFAPTDWAATPWPELAKLVPLALDGWSPEEVRV